ncbi:hypothetical protein F5X99DRAFT_152768 [Biscogniauxia marginata]|nr:hypothetical protein F5X99DRAFT_152768 [Biscogniauxia marginata]
MAGKRGTKSSTDAGPPGSRPNKARASATAKAREDTNPSVSTQRSNKKRRLNANDDNKAIKKQKASRGDQDDEDSDAEVDEIIEDPSNGLDRTLPPISSVNEAFIDLIKKARGGLTQIADNNVLDLRVGTMCSGTEAPIFSLKMAQEAFGRLNPGKEFLRFSHVFSVENEDFKQAYIARNTEGSIVFRDVRDFVDPGATRAPTAMGGLERIPTKIDLLVAGCSCVDFSTLNTKKKSEYNDQLAKKAKGLFNLQDQSSDEFKNSVKDLFEDIVRCIDELGESGQTFFSMLSYVRNHRPKVVILENVMNAPWEQNCNVWFYHIGYAATFIKVDTKDFWIPQTRMRGYLIAVDRDVFEASSDQIVNAWSDEMKKLKRRASSPVTDWLLPPTHSLAIRACQDDAEKALNGRDRDSKWIRSRVRHTRVRRVEKLGNERPLTEWGSVVKRKPWDKMSPLFIASLNDRSKDCIEIWQLRALLSGLPIDSKRYTYDTRHKIRIFDLSQNIDRGVTGSPFGVSPCVTPRGSFYLTNQGRALSGYEGLALQGLPIFHLDLSRETQDQLRDLAGNAMSTTVVGAALVSALISIHANGRSYSFKKNEDEASPAGSSLILQRSPRNFRQDLMPHPEFTTMAGQPFSMPSLKELWKRCRRYCFCNGAARYSSDSFYRCSVCGTIRCFWCAGNPAHEYDSYERTAEPVLLEEVPHVIMSLFPSTISHLIADGFVESYDSIERTALSVPQLAESLRSATFYYKEVYTTEVITISFTAKDTNAAFKLQAIVSGDGLVWKLYLDPWCELGQQVLRALRLSTAELSHPVARAIISQDSQSPIPFMASWQLWSFKPMPLRLRITSPENKAYLDITMANPGDISKLPGDVQQDLCSISGKYIHKPHCDASENSLHVGELNQLFLFKDPTKTLNPDHDCYVISKECRLLEHYENREALVKFPNHFNPKKLVNEEVDVTIEGIWFKPSTNNGVPSDESLANPFKNIERLEVHARGQSVLSTEDHDGQVLAQFQLVRHSQGDSFMILSKYEHATQQTDDWITVERHDLPALYDLVSPANVKLAGTELLKFTATLIDPKPCTDCSPTMPMLHWVPKAKAQLKEKTQIEPHRRYDEMTEYDAKLRRRLLPFEVQVKVTPPQMERLSPDYLSVNPESQRDLKVIGVRYAINPVVLIHQALSHLPLIEGTLRCSESRDNVSTTMWTEVNAADNLNYKFKPFRDSLVPLSQRTDKIVPAKQPATMKKTLSSLQLQSLAWMLQREQSKDFFVEQEIEEHIVPELKARLVGCAIRRVFRRGGVLADDVGYGKTVISLALMGCQQTFDENESIRLREAQDSCCIHLKASLVVVPKHLVDQWAGEAIAFLQIRKDEVLTIKTMGNLKAEFKRFKSAKIIIVSNSLFNEKAYHFTLAQYAGSLSPPTTDSESGSTKLLPGRAFEKWYKDTVPYAQEHISQHNLALTQSNGNKEETLDDLVKKIRQRWMELQDAHQSIIKDRYDEQTGDGLKVKRAREAAEKQRKAADKGEKDIADETGGEVKGTTDGAEQGAKLPSAIEEVKKKPDTWPASLDDPFSNFIQLLESFSFARVVYDEFSYNNPMASLFFRNVTALSKWVLSATPPTRNLAAMCEIAGLINVHVARPMDLRIGLPRITEGPKVQGRTKTETLLSYGKLASEKCVQERQGQGHAFLKYFASANPLDQGHFGAVKIEESVVVCNMRLDETLRYMDLQQELQNNSLDVELLSREFRKLLPDGLEWRGNNGKALAAQALILNASLRPTHNAVQAENLREERKKLLESASTHLRSLSGKAIWLANRIVNRPEEIQVQSAENAVKDICVLFEYILSKDLAHFGGYDGWKAVFGAIFPNCKRPEDVRDHSGPKDETGLLHDLNFHRSGPWTDFFTIKEDDLGRIDENEAKHLLEDIQRYNTGVVFEGSSLDGLKTVMANFEEEFLLRDEAEHLNEEELLNKIAVYNKHSQIALRDLCRQNCIKITSSEGKAGLAKCLAKHDLGLLSDDDYSGVAFRNLERKDFPFFDGRVNSRGGRYTLTRSEAVDVALAMKAATELVVRLAEQVMIVENLLKPKYEHRCDNCGITTHDLHFVPRCGHLLCRKHLDDTHCGDADRHDLKHPSQCPSLLVDRTIPLSKIDSKQRSLPSLGQGTATPMVSNTDGLVPSSKSQMIVDAIKSVPDDDCVLIFAQYEKQLEELRDTLVRNGLKVDQNTAEPKIRLLKLNDSESAGSNFQYANHVMFASPLSVDLQEEFDAFMKQATGRCVRYGQKKVVHVYHFVTANTIEVDMLELRRKSHILVQPGQAIGRLVERPAEGFFKTRKDSSGDVTMTDASANTNNGEERVCSNLDSDDVWRMMNETNWLTTVGLES